MKFTTIYLGENTIELYNSLLGVETVKVNGEKVSSIFSIAGADHTFTLIENGEKVECKLSTGYGLHGVVIDFYKNDQAIIKSNKVGCFVFFLLIVLVLAGLRFLDSLI